MIQIERLRMHLPHGYQHRATSIALLLAEALSKQSVPEDVSLKSASISPQAISPTISDSEIAQQIASQIVALYRRGGA